MIEQATTSDTEQEGTNTTLALLRWLAILPATAGIAKVTGLFCGFVVFGAGFLCHAMLANLLWPGPYMHSALSIGIGICAGLVMAALSGFIFAPGAKLTIYKCMPIALFFIGMCLQISTETFPIKFVKEITLLHVPIWLSPLLATIIVSILNPDSVIARLREIFRDKLTCLDKMVLTFQLELLTILITSTMFPPPRWLTSLTGLQDWSAAFLTAAAVISSHLTFRHRLSPQGLDDSKLLNIINLIIAGTYFIAKAGSLAAGYRSP